MKRKPRIESVRHFKMRQNGSRDGNTTLTKIACRRARSNDTSIVIIYVVIAAVGELPQISIGIN